MEKANNQLTGRYPWEAEESEMRPYEGFDLNLHGFCNGCQAFDVTADWVSFDNARFWVISCSHKKVCGQIQKFIENKLEAKNGLNKGEIK